MTVKENMTAAIIPKISKNGVISHKDQSSLADKYIDSMNIKTPSAEQLIKYLSGGNQQKVILSRWLCMHPKLMILDEPTRGIGRRSKV